MRRVRATWRYYDEHVLESSVENLGHSAGLGSAAASKLKRITMGRPKALTDAGIEAFREARPDVHLQLGDQDYPATK